MLKELENLNMEKAPTRYLLSLFKKCQIAQYNYYDAECNYYTDKAKYDLYNDWENKLRKVLSTREHIVTSKIERKKIRQNAAKRKV